MKAALTCFPTSRGADDGERAASGDEGCGVASVGRIEK
jgi:hypothetical protein